MAADCSAVTLAIHILWNLTVLCVARFVSDSWHGSNLGGYCRDCAMDHCDIRAKGHCLWSCWSAHTTSRIYAMESTKCTMSRGPSPSKSLLAFKEGKLDKHGKPNDKTPKDFLEGYKSVDGASKPIELAGATPKKLVQEVKSEEAAASPMDEDSGSGDGDNDGEKSAKKKKKKEGKTPKKDKKKKKDKK